MLKNYFWIINLISIFFIFSAGHADNNKFHQTRDEMIETLLQKPMKFRSFVPESQTRSIVVLEKKQTVSEPEVITVVGKPPMTHTPVYEKKTITLVPGREIPKLRLKIEFDHDSAALRRTSFYLLKELGMALRSEELEHYQMLVAGHTDSDGSDEYNLRLSIERADTVKQYLAINFDIPDSRLKIRGYGESMPAMDNTSHRNKQINRRVEVWVLRD